VGTKIVTTIHSGYKKCVHLVSVPMVFYVHKTKFGLCAYLRNHASIPSKDYSTY